MIADPIAREQSPQHLDPEDICNYMEQLADMCDVAIPFDTHILNIHQLFDEDWEYIGAYYSCNTGRNTDIFWIWVDADWNAQVFEASPVPMYRYISETFNITEPNYRGYGNCGDWMLLSAGSMPYTLFMKKGSKS